MDKTPEQIENVMQLLEQAKIPWPNNGVSLEGLKRFAHAVIAHARPQIEREAYKKILGVVKDEDELDHYQWDEKYGDATLKDAIRALAEGK